jgi:hypothetical protein
MGSLHFLMASGGACWAAAKLVASFLDADKIAS